MARVCPMLDQIPTMTHALGVQTPAASGMLVLDGRGRSGPRRVQRHCHSRASAAAAVGHGRRLEEDDRADHRQSDRHDAGPRGSDHPGAGEGLPDRAALQGRNERQEGPALARDRREAVQDRSRSGQGPARGGRGVAREGQGLQGRRGREGQPGARSGPVAARRG